jgi:two-component system, NarL family, sensor kinase
MWKKLCRKLLLGTILEIAFLSCYAQSKEIDSLFQIIKTDHNDSVNVLCLNELSWLFRIEKPDSALIYATRAKSIAEKIDFKVGIATSLNRIGEINRIQGDYNQAIEKFDNALKIEKEINNSYGIARAYSQLTLLYSSIGQIEKAFNTGQLSIELWKKNNNLSELAKAYDRQAILYEYLGRFDEALNLIYSSLQIQNQLNDSTNIVYSYMNLANLFLELKNYTKSLEYNNIALNTAEKFNDQFNQAKIYTNISRVYYNLKKINLAIDYDLKSIEIKKRLKLDKTLDTNYDNLGLYYSDLGKYDVAIMYYNKCIELINQIGEKRNLSIVYTNIGNLYLNKKQYYKALSYYSKGLKYAEKNKEKLIILELYHNIYRSFIEMGNLDQAIPFNNKYISLRDSLDLAYLNTINLKDSYFEEQGKNQLLQKDNLIQEIKLKRRNIIVISLSVGILLISLLFFTIFRTLKFRQRTILAEKNSEINQQKISELLKDQELKSMSAMLEGQEGERKRIAQDLHDRLGSMLSMVKLHFKSVEENIQVLRESNLIMYSKANDLLDEACEEVRKIANDLNSGVLNKFGLIPALKSLQDSILATGQLKIEVLDFGFDENRLDFNIEINLYRIIQELLSNILKHSKATEVTIQLLKKEKRLNIVVEDNGIGFDINVIKNKKGMGLKNMESRVDSLNGDFNIDSGKGAGTTITIDLPLNETK